jgi:hypothetical protein
MKKTMSIDIAGQLFRIDEDAYELLVNYLRHVTDSFRGEQGGEETIADIETRIAEIFGGGQEPPIIVTKEMISEMINIMGAPEDYYAETTSSGGNAVRRGKNMYNPNSLSAKAGRVLSELSKAFRKFFYTIFRVLMIVFGSVFCLFGFVLLFTFVLTLFFNNTPLVRDLFNPEMINPNALLGIVLHTGKIWPVIILSALVIMIPLSMLTYLGIKMVFNIKGNSKIAGIIIFITWVVSVAVLGVLLSTQLSVYSNHEQSEAVIAISNPPDTIIIAPLNRINSRDFREISAIDNISFFNDNSTGNICGSIRLYTSSNDSTGSSLSIDKRACGKTDYEARNNVKSIGYNYKFSGDTIYLDEYYSVNDRKKWNGSEVKVEIMLPQGTILKTLPGMDMRMFGYRKSFDDTHLFKTDEWGYEEISR